jgi:GDP-L-fucose synthase
VGYHGCIENDLTKPDGTPRKLSDISLIRATGWSPRISLRDGLAAAYKDFLDESAAYQLRSA